jgi:uncharacterized protein YfbU (UPF0304 family)
MKSITIRVEDEVHAELECRARSLDLSVSAFLRGQIDTLVARHPQRERLPAVESLSAKDRLMLVKLEEILERVSLDYEGVELATERQEILHQGYTGEYHGLFATTPQPELSLETCQLVWDILDMFEELGVALRDLDEATLDDLGPQAERLTFAGLDLDDPLEGRMLAYVRHLSRTDRWKGLGSRLATIGDAGNSHTPLLERYRRMGAAYSRILRAGSAEASAPDLARLDVAALRAIAEAWEGGGRPGSRSESARAHPMCG